MGEQGDIMEDDIWLLKSMVRQVCRAVLKDEYHIVQ